MNTYRQATDLEGFVLAHRFHVRRTFYQQQRRLFFRHELRMPIVAQEVQVSVTPPKPLEKDPGSINTRTRHGSPNRH